MKILFILLVVLIVAGPLIYFFSPPIPGQNIKIVKVAEGMVGVFQIGQSKREMLNNKDNTFGSNLCSPNWISVSEMNSLQRNCLESSDEWVSGDVGKKYCPEKSNWHTTLYFENKMLKTVEIRCSVAI